MYESSLSMYELPFIQKPILIQTVRDPLLLNSHYSQNKILCLSLGHYTVLIFIILCILAIPISGISMSNYYQSVNSTCDLTKHVNYLFGTSVFVLIFASIYLIVVIILLYNKVTEKVYIKIFGYILMGVSWISTFSLVIGLGLHTCREFSEINDIIFMYSMINGPVISILTFMSILMF